MQDFKELVRNKFPAIHVSPGQRIIVTYKKNYISEETNKVIAIVEEPVATYMVEEPFVFDEAIVFEGKYEDRKAMGGMVLEKEK